MNLEQMWDAPAYLSEDKLYRYTLRRDLGTPLTSRWPVVLWIMLNPSTADATQDDPTIRRCMGFSTAWGASRMYVVNLFALRATDPKDLKAARHPVDLANGGVNDFCIGLMAHKTWHEGGAVIFAWGAHGSFRGRSEKVQRLLKINEWLKSYSPLCLGQTKHSEPKHPLYLSRDTEPRSFEVAVDSNGTQE